MKQGTLCELGVIDGDRVVCVSIRDLECCHYTVGKTYTIGDCDNKDCVVEPFESGSIFRRADPKTWGEMTDAEKGALLFANHDGKTIQFSRSGEFWFKASSPTWRDTLFYRVKPETEVREFWMGIKSTGKLGKREFNHNPQTYGNGAIKFRVTDGDWEIIEQVKL